MSTGRAILIGVIMAIFAIAVVAGLVAAGVIGPSSGALRAADGPVLVALVLPNESGVLEPRVIDVYTRTPSGWSVRSVAPTQPAVVSGTTGKTLADSYIFGGGAALAKAYGRLGRGEAAAWVVVDPAAWSAVSSGTPVSVDLPSTLEVFDGSELLTFPEGPRSVPATQTALLLSGAHYLPAAQNAAVRASVGDAVGAALAAASASKRSGLRSDLRDQQLAQWLGTLGSRVRGAGD